MITLPEKFIIISCPHLLGRLGNYLHNIAFCTRILFELEKYITWNKYLYFNCQINGSDGHGHIDIFKYNDITNSYHSTIFKFDPIDINDNISSITTQISGINNDFFYSSIKHIETKQRHVYIKDVQNYSILFTLFPIIIETFINDEYAIIHLNNMTYEGLDLPNLSKNLYLSDPEIINFIGKHINFILSYNNKINKIFIKMDFALLSGHLVFQSDDFNKYFKKKLFSYKIGDIESYKYVENIYNNCCKKDSIYIAMHFRGGDYGDPSKQAEYYAVLGPKYYLDCMCDIYIANIGKELIFVMFCSPCDLEYIENEYVPYIKRNIIFDNIKLYTYKEFLGDYNINDQLNIYLMGLFDYLCISNSTYSWWSSFFSTLYNDNKKIYAPSIYKYPENSYLFNKLYIKLDYYNNIIIENNYIINIYTWYGITSSIYIYVLLNDLIDSLDNREIDDLMFHKYLDAIINLLQNNNLLSDNLPDNKNYQNIINHFRYEFLNIDNKIFKLEHKDKLRYNIKNISQLMNTPDRNYIHYKYISIKDAIMFI